MTRQFRRYTCPIRERKGLILFRQERKSCPKVPKSDLGLFPRSVLLCQLRVTKEAMRNGRGVGYWSRRRCVAILETSAQNLMRMLLFSELKAKESFPTFPVRAQGQ